MLKYIKEMRYLILISTITTIVAMGSLFNYLGWHGYYAGYTVGAIGMIYYFGMSLKYIGESRWVYKECHCNFHAKLV